MGKPARVTLKDGSTRWRQRVDLGRDPITGARRQTTVSAPTLKACQDAATRARSAALSGAAAATTLTVERYLLDHWLPHKRASGIAGQTLGNYEADVRLHLIPAFGKVKLAKLSTLQVQGWVNGQTAEPSTIRQRLLVLRMACKQAVRWRLLTVSPCEGVVAPQVTPPTPTVLSPGQLDRLLDASRDDPCYPAYCLLARCGLRVGEVLALQWGDLAGDVLTVRRTMTVDAANRAAVREATKTGKARAVLLDAETRAALAGLPRRALWLFPRDHDPSRPLSDDTLRRALSRACRRAGVPRVRPHDLRHTHSTHMMREGIHPAIAMARLGHTTEAMLQRYSHPDVRDQAGVIARLTDKGTGS